MNHRWNSAKINFELKESIQLGAKRKAISSFDFGFYSRKFAFSFNLFLWYFPFGVAIGHAAHMWWEYEFYIIDNLDKFKQARIK